MVGCHGNVTLLTRRNIKSAATLDDQTLALPGGRTHKPRLLLCGGFYCRLSSLTHPSTSAEAALAHRAPLFQRRVNKRALIEKFTMMRLSLKWIDKIVTQSKVKDLMEGINDIVTLFMSCEASRILTCNIYKPLIGINLQSNTSNQQHCASGHVTVPLMDLCDAEGGVQSHCLGTRPLLEPSLCSGAHRSP